MKKLTSAIFLFLCLALVQSYAQNTRSKQVVILDGKKYYKHIVEQNETIDGLCKLYDVSLQELVEANNTVQTGIRHGEVLKIPLKESTLNAFEPKTIKHTVKRKQTLYGISRMYDVSIDEIVKLNPVLLEQNKQVNKGQVLTIVTDGKHFANPYYIGEDDDFVYVKTKKKQTITEVAKKFDISTNELIKSNPLLKNKIKKKTLIKIPKPKQTYQIVDEDIIKDGTKEEEIITSDPLFYEIPENKVEAIDYLENPFEIRVGVMLPLNLNENERIGLNSRKEPKDNTFYRNTLQVLDFYNGILMAADTLLKKGIRTKIFIYDTQADPAKVKQILEKDELKQMHIVFGPVYANNIDTIENFAKENRINFVSPLFYNRSVNKENCQLSTNPFLFQLEANTKTRIHLTAKAIVNQGIDTVFLLHNLKDIEVENMSEREKYELKIIRAYKDELFTAYTKANKVHKLKYAEITYRESSLREIKSHLDSTSRQIIIVPSTEKTFVLNITSSLNVLAKEYPIFLYGTPDWELYENLELEHLYNLNMHYTTSTYIDYDNYNVIEFIKKYKTTFGSEPEYLAFKSYDAFIYFAELFMNYGKNLQATMDSKFNRPAKGISSVFDFERINNIGGFENTDVFIIRYTPDYEIKQIK